MVSGHSNKLYSTDRGGCVRCAASEREKPLPHPFSLSCSQHDITGRICRLGARQAVKRKSPKGNKTAARTRKIAEQHSEGKTAAAHQTET